MNCDKHPEKEAVASCRLCGAGVCAECADRTELWKTDKGVLCIDCYKFYIQDDIEDFKKEYRKARNMSILIIALLVIGLALTTFGIVVSLLSGIFEEDMIYGGYILTGIVPTVSAVIGFFKSLKVDEQNECNWVSLILYLLLFGLIILIAPFFTIKYLFDLRKQRKEARYYMDIYQKDLDNLEAEWS
ncbi:MAG: hypothetical protein IKC87_00400 [Clostridia bacterium]|nr:hypothetical protein [Clostridia bacterium]